jgi:cellulose synthase/poly-beta-1,6-N-acetylglucosamine synthase-like glycosyltransferase
MLQYWLGWAGAVFCVLVSLELARSGLLLYRNLKSEPKILDGDESGMSAVLPLVSVIIPAKDEERCIGQSAAACIGARYPAIELVLVDDRSTDGTAAILAELAEKDPTIKVVSIRELPDGWTGKTHALYLGALKASGDIFLFTDADTIIGSDVIRKSVRYLVENKLDMLGLLPGFIAGGFNEIAVYPHLALGLSYLYPLSEVNDETKPAALSSGAFIMITRAAYEKVGTWERFRDSVTEDIAMSRAVKDEGLKLLVARADGAVRTRGFNGLGELCRFWRRTLYGGLEKSGAKIFRLTLSYFALLVVTLLFAASGVMLTSGRGDLSTASLFLFSGLAGALVIIPFSIFINNRPGDWRYGPTAPFGVAVAFWVTLSTLFTVLADIGIHWRGSRYR